MDGGDVPAYKHVRAHATWRDAEGRLYLDASAARARDAGDATVCYVVLPIGITRRRGAPTSAEAQIEFPEPDDELRLWALGCGDDAPPDAVLRRVERVERAELRRAVAIVTFADAACAGGGASARPFAAGGAARALFGARRCPAAAAARRKFRKKKICATPLDIMDFANIMASPLVHGHGADDFDDDGEFAGEFPSADGFPQPNYDALLDVSAPKKAAAPRKHKPADPAAPKKAAAPRKPKAPAAAAAAAAAPKAASRKRKAADASEGADADASEGAAPPKKAAVPRAPKKAAAKAPAADAPKKPKKRRLTGASAVRATLALQKSVSMGPGRKGKGKGRLLQRAAVKRLMMTGAARALEKIKADADSKTLVGMRASDLATIDKMERCAISKDALAFNSAYLLQKLFDICNRAIIFSYIGGHRTVMGQDAKYAITFLNNPDTLRMSDEDYAVFAKRAGAHATHPDLAKIHALIDEQSGMKAINQMRMEQEADGESGGESDGEGDDDGESDGDDGESDDASDGESDA